MKCNNCKHGLQVDYGYSNWTVEGTDFGCEHHPESPFDMWYGDDERLNYATQCEFYTNGSNLSLDVEQEEAKDLTASDIERFNKVFNMTVTGHMTDEELKQHLENIIKEVN